MILYHMSDAAEIGKRLIPDAKGCREVCEPFVRALEVGWDCFLAMMLNAEYMYAVLNKYHLREWSNYAKWATEGIFEYIRRKEFPECVSRVGCVFCYDDLGFSKRLYREDWSEESEEDRGKLRLFKVEADGRTDRRDMTLYDTAYDALSENRDSDAAMDFARRYFSGEQSEKAVWEYLCADGAAVVEDISYILHRNE